jgi:serine/threonine protein kinase
LSGGGSDSSLTEAGDSSQSSGTVPQQFPDETPASGGSRAAGPREWDFLQPAQTAEELGRLGVYRILRVLGKGGMGVVFEAQDIRLRRPVALKAMLPHIVLTVPGAGERFLREARAMAAIEHDHIVTVYQVGEENSVPFIAMQLLRGETLEKRLKREQRLPLAETLRVGREIAEALVVAHGRGLIHRDIKPSNVWLEEGHGRVKLLDLGLALSSDDAQLTQTGAIVGTPAYMAPEQAMASHDVDHRCDLFSLGCILYRTATGKPAFHGPTTLSTLRALELHEPEPPARLDSAVPLAFSGLVMQLLAKQPNRRPKSAQEVVDRIRWVASQQPPSSQPASEYVDTLAMHRLTPVAAPAQGTAESIRPGTPPATTPVTGITAGPVVPRATPVSPGRPVGGKRRLLLIGAPILLLLMVVAATVIWQVLPPASSDNAKDTKDNSDQTSTDKDKKKNQEQPPPVPVFEIDPIHRVHYQYSTNEFQASNFGLTVAANEKKLTYEHGGKTNSILIRVDGDLIHFGSVARGRWKLPPDLGKVEKSKSKYVWETADGKIRITQVVDIVPGKQPIEKMISKDGKEHKKYFLEMERCLAAYLIENMDTESHKVGLRFLLDTMIGKNDAAPFAVPGQSFLVTTQGNYEGKAVPQFVQALERTDDLSQPGTVALLNLKVGGELEPPERASLTHWTSKLSSWEIPMEDIGSDSCAVLYWQDKELKPKEKRCLGFTYGLGMKPLTQDESPFQMGLTLDGDFEPGKDFTILTYGRNPEPGQKLKLVVPEGLNLVEVESEQVLRQPVSNDTSLVTWTLRAARVGKFEIKLETKYNDKTVRVEHPIYITTPDPTRSLTIQNIFDQ